MATAAKAAGSAAKAAKAAGTGAVAGMSMALDPKVRHSLATGDWVGAMAHGSYHTPFIGNGRNTWDAWQMGKPWSAAGHAGLFGVEALGMRSAGKVRGIRVPLTKPARLVRKGGKASTGVTKSGGVKASQKLPSHLQSIIKPDGKLIGKQLGNNPAIHTIPASDAEHIIKRLIKSGAKKAERPRYPGTWYQFPNGKGFGVRVTNSVESSKHGTKNCIDLIDLGIEIEKLKF